jgi:hypothetical protein
MIIKDIAKQEIPEIGNILPNLGELNSHQDNV